MTFIPKYEKFLKDLLINRTQIAVSLKYSSNLTVFNSGYEKYSNIYERTYKPYIS